MTAIQHRRYALVVEEKVMKITAVRTLSVEAAMKLAEYGFVTGGSTKPYRHIADIGFASSGRRPIWYTITASARGVLRWIPGRRQSGNILI